MEHLSSLNHLLACPVCKNPEIRKEEKGFACPSCHRYYPLIHSDGESMVDFVPDANASFQNPVQHLWNYLLSTSSEGEDYELHHGLTFDNMDAMHSYFKVEGDLILDVGGGSGYLRRYLEPKQTYIDIEPDPAAFARRSAFKDLDAQLGNPFIFLRGVAEYLPFRANSFDALYMGGMIEHVFDINFTFSEVSRVLKPGGHLYIFAGCAGYAVKTGRISTARKTINYLKTHGLRRTIKRIWQKVSYSFRQKFNPWKNIINFSQGQTESGHIYDNLFKKDIIGLAERYHLSPVKDIDIPETGDTVFIFEKPKIV